MWKSNNKMTNIGNLSASSTDSSGYVSGSSPSGSGEFVNPRNLAETQQNTGELGGKGHSRNSLNVCAHCGELPAEGEKLLKCSGCFSASYCSKEHQRYDWKKHKMRCKVIQRQNEEREQARGEQRVKRQHEQDLFNPEHMEESPGPEGCQGGQPPVFFLPPAPEAEEVQEKVANLYLTPATSQHSWVPLARAQKDHSINTPYQISLEDHLRNCAETAAKTGTHITQYQAFCLRIQRMAKFAIERLNEYGWCVIDNFLGQNHCDTITNEVKTLYNRALFEDGQLMKSVQGNSTKDIRSDKIYWFDNRDERAAEAVTISFLISMTDSITVQMAGKIPPYSINGRSRAMIACYPSNGTRYVKHVDNPIQDGRCITVIYYLNKNWCNEDGGLMKMYPEGAERPVEITPDADRLLLFWSDKRNPHEVLPTYRHRYAITVWYFDAEEKAKAMAKTAAKQSKHDHPIQSKQQPHQVSTQSQQQQQQQQQQQHQHQQISRPSGPKSTRIDAEFSSGGDSGVHIRPDGTSVHSLHAWNEGCLPGVGPDGQIHFPHFGFHFP